MGQQIQLTIPPGITPDWQQVHEHLQAQGQAVTIRMIDGLPAFPDEVPEPSWKELRVAMAGGMISIRKDLAQLVFVIWGNADAELLRSRDLLVHAFASHCQGSIELGDGQSCSAGEFGHERGLGHSPTSGTAG